MSNLTLDRSKVSTQVNMSNRAHPFHDTVMEAMLKNHELVKAAQRARALAVRITPTHVDLTKTTLGDGRGFFDVLKQGTERDPTNYYAMVRQVVVQMLGKESSQPIVKSNDVLPIDSFLSRMQLSKKNVVVEVGSGSGGKSVPVHGGFGKFVAVESNPIHEASLARRKKIEYRITQFDVSIARELNANFIFSINALTQTGVFEYDGVHIFPNMPLRHEMGKCGLMNDCDDYTTYHQEVNGVMYVDTWPKKIPKYGIGEYVVTNTYSHDVVAVHMSDVLSTEAYDMFRPLGFHLTATDSLPEYRNPTVKTDGEAYRLVVYDRKAALIRRDGRYFCGITDYPGKFSIDLDISTSIRLIRVNSWNGFQPYHTLELLRHFLRYKQITIGGIDVEGPIDYLRGTRYKHFEGLVYRYNEKDYFMRAIHSVDVNKTTYDELCASINGMALCLKSEAEPWGDRVGIWEVLIKRYGDTCRLVFFQPRHKRNTDTIQKIKRILEFPTIENGAALFDWHNGIGDEEPRYHMLGE